MDGSGKWLLDLPPYVLWSKDHTYSYLWVHGVPGIGKTCLARSIASRIQTESEHSAAFFCDAKGGMLSASVILRSLIAQLAQKDSTFISHLYRKHLQGFSLEQAPVVIWRRLVEYFCRLSRRAIIVIDGLDECDQLERAAILNIISSGQNEHAVRWLIFSRFTSDIADCLLNNDLVIAPYYPQEDIEAFLRYPSDEVLMSTSEQSNTDLIKLIVRKSRGSLLWVKLVMQEIQREKRAESIEILKSLPSALDDLYEVMLKKLERSTEDASIIRNIFTILASSLRYLSLDEFNEFVLLQVTDNPKISDITKHLGRMTRGFVMSGSDSVRFTHRTFQEYICSHRYEGIFSVDSGQAHSTMGQTCISYLARPSFSQAIGLNRFQKLDMALVLRNHPLLVYAASYWTEHIERATREEYYGGLDELSSLIESQNILSAIEIAITTQGLDCIQRWIRSLSNVKELVIATLLNAKLEHFLFKLSHVVRLYGCILEEYPSEIHNLMQKDDPQRSPLSLPAQPAVGERDPFIAILNQKHVVAIAVNNNGLLAASDKKEVSIWDIQAQVAVARLGPLKSAIVALSFNCKDSLAVLLQDGRLCIVSTLSWQVTRELSGVNTPEVVQTWNCDQFWTEDLGKRDPLNIALRFIGKGILAAATLIDLETRFSRQALPNLKQLYSICQLSCTSTGEMVALLDDGQTFARRLAADESPLGNFAGAKDHAAQKRLLAMSATGRLIAICSFRVMGNYTISQNILECLGRDSKNCFFKQEFGSEVSITAAAFSSDETMLAVSTYSAQTRLDTTSVWSLSQPPEVVFSLEQDDSYTACLAFAVQDSILIQAGLHVRLWDVSESTRAAKSRILRIKKFAAVKLSNDCSRIASISLSNGIPSSLMMFSTNGQTQPIEIPLPTKAYDGGVELKNLLVYSADGDFLAWDHMILSTKTNTLVEAVPLLSSETVYYVCGFSPDARIAVYSIVGSSESGEPCSIDRPEVQRSFQVITYKPSQKARRVLRSSGKVKIMRPHPLQPLVVLIGDDSYTLYIYNVESLQLLCNLDLVDELPGRWTIEDISFTFGKSLRLVATEEKWAAGNLKVLDIVYGDERYEGVEDREDSMKHEGRHEVLIIPRQYRMTRSQQPQLLSSGIVVCILWEGWIVVIDEMGTKRRVNYLAVATPDPESQYPIGERNGFICVVVVSRSASDWLRVKNIEIYDGTSGL